MAGYINSSGSCYCIIIIIILPRSRPPSYLPPKPLLLIFLLLLLLLLLLIIIIIIIIIIILQASFSHRCYLVDFFWGTLDSSEYSGRCQQYCSLDGLDSSFDFQFFRVFFSCLRGPFQVYLLQLVPPSPSYSTVLWQAPSINKSFRFLSFSFCDPLVWKKLQNKFFFLSFIYLFFF